MAVSAAKIVVGKLSGSVSMVADGYHSLMDGTNNVVGLVVAGFAYAPPDEGHPYGHRKFETAATLLIGFALLSLAYQVVEEALHHVSGSRLPAIGLPQLGGDGRDPGGQHLRRQLRSAPGPPAGQQLPAGRRRPHALGHLRHAGGGGVLRGRARRPALGGPAVAVGIASFIAVLGVRILVGSFHTLTDRAVLPRQALAARGARGAGVRACGDIRTRGGPDAVYVDLMVNVDGELSLQRRPRRSRPDRSRPAGRASRDRGRGRPPGARTPASLSKGVLRRTPLTQPSLLYQSEL